MIIGDYRTFVYTRYKTDLNSPFPHLVKYGQPVRPKNCLTYLYRHYMPLIKSIIQLYSRKIQEGYAKMVNICEKACGPSTGGVPSVFAENQRINSTIFMGRPIDQTGPPIVLFHDDFGQFINDFAI
ncbi:unnamed protein product [Rhizophagus irregularis]|nr:unnamed protein product [Rhizophagus irregularis]CAB5212259.1 unnamed protein product [Rhizophagus irregularis]